MVGASAGLPLAGVVAAVLLSRVARRIQAELAELHLTTRLDASEAAADMDTGGIMHFEQRYTVSNFGIADDEVYVHMARNDEILDHTVLLVQAIFKAYRRYGLELHLHAKKTCAMFSISGAGREGVMRRLEHLKKHEGGIQFAVGENVLKLPISGDYKHVGCHTQASAKVSADVTCKMAAMAKAASMLERFVLANKGIPEDVRLGVAHTHVIPCGDFGAGIWHTMTQADQAKVSRAIMDVYRIVDGCKRAAPGAGVTIKSDAQVVADLQVMAPMHRVLFARIRILFHVALRKRTDLLSLMHACKSDQKSWYTQVLSDLSLVAASAPKLSEMREASMGDWLAYFCRNGKKALLPIRDAFTGMAATPGAAANALV